MREQRIELNDKEIEFLKIIMHSYDELLGSIGCIDLKESGFFDKYDFYDLVCKLGLEDNLKTR